MSLEHITVERHQDVAVLTLASGKVNAMSPALIQETEAVLHEIAEDSQVAAIVLTGGESRFFSFGLDVAYLLNLNRGDMAVFLKQLNTILRRLYTLPKPLVAAVNGHAMAGGLLMAMTADYRIAAEGKFSIGLSEVKLGIAAPAASIRMLAHQVGHRVTQQLCTYGTTLDPEGAKACGLYNELVPIESLSTRALEKASELGKLSGLALNKRYLSTGTYDVDSDLATSEDDAWLDAWFHPAVQGRLRALAERK